MSDHEFNAEQSQLVNKFRQRLLYVAVLFATLGILHLLSLIMISGGRTDLWAQGLGILIFLLLGYIYSRPLDNLKRIVSTTGNDIQELMAAMDNLRMAYLMMGILMAFGSVTTLIDVIRLLVG